MPYEQKLWKGLGLTELFIHSEREMLSRLVVKVQENQKLNNALETAGLKEQPGFHDLVAVEKRKLKGRSNPDIVFIPMDFQLT